MYVCLSVCVCAYLSDCEVCPLARRHTLYTVDDFIDGNCYTNKTGKPYCMRLFYFGWCIVGVQLICVMMVTILYIKTFVAFDFDTSFISRQITDSDLDDSGG